MGWGRFSAVEYYKAALELGKDYDVIILQIINSPHNNRETVRELRQGLGFKGYLICVAQLIDANYVKSFIDLGANQMVDIRLETADYVEIRRGE